MDEVKEGVPSSVKHKLTEEGSVKQKGSMEELKKGVSSRVKHGEELKKGVSSRKEANKGASCTVQN
jgi:hypothetical protein